MNFFHLILRNYHLCRTVLLDQGLIAVRHCSCSRIRQLLKVKNMKSRSRKLVHGVIVVIGLALNSAAFAQQAQSQEMTTTTTDQQTTILPPQELDSLVAPIAFYSDPLLAQTLAASTYPLEVIQLQQWMANNKFARPSAGGRCRQAAVGPKRPVTGGVSRRRAADGGQCPMDGRLGKRVPRAAIGRNGCRSAHACKGQGTGNLKTTAQ